MENKPSIEGSIANLELSEEQLFINTMTPREQKVAEELGYDLKDPNDLDDVKLVFLARELEGINDFNLGFFQKKWFEEKSRELDIKIREFGQERFGLIMSDWEKVLEESKNLIKE
ncbi:MAG: hypothetical protein ACD_58C00120G0016 [uncultured bacterium]|nr:MAG: hypothetical protein ACD_58C00120G0016 [uncultured bacterium]